MKAVQSELRVVQSPALTFPRPGHCDRLMANLRQIVHALSSLTVLEAAKLSKMLEEKWGAPKAEAGLALLFDERERTRSEPLQRGENLFEFYDCCGRHGYNEFRALVNGWLAQLPADDCKSLISRMHYGRNREFGASLVELSLHPFIVRSGYSATLHPEIPGTKKRPDYAATDQSGATVAYIEVTTRNPPAAKDKQENEENPIYLAIDAANIPAGSALGYRLVRAGKSTPPLEALVREVEGWARDNAEAAKTAEVSKTFTAGDWVIELDLYSGGSNPEPGVHAIGVIDMGGGIISPHKELRHALCVKSDRYGALDKPYLIVVADGKDQLFGKDAMRSALTEAVFGDELVEFKNGTMEVTHAKNGFWNGPDGPCNRHVSGVLLLPDTGLWKLREDKRQPLLAVNPWGERPLPDPLRKMRRLENDNGKWLLREGEQFADIIGVPDPWPPAEPE